MAGGQLRGCALSLLLLLVPSWGDDGSGACLSTPEIIEQLGYTVERHVVVSQNGYILILFRIPGGRNCSQPGEPVMVMHGLLSDSDGWMQLGNQSLPILLAESGKCYDVWMLNGRGNKYSRNHTTLDPDKLEYWLFSWHEQGVYDLPACFDYILNVSGKSYLSYVGHSMGTTVFLVMCSERPEYTARVRLANLLAPVCYMSHIPNLVLRALAPFTRVIAGVLLPLLHGELPASELAQLAPSSQGADSNATQALQAMHAAVDQIRRGWDRRDANLSSFAEQQSEGCRWSNGSIRQLEHYGQEINSGRFRRFDFGLVRNLIEYHRATPPDYNLQNVTCPVIAWHTACDELVAEEDVKQMAADTPPNVLFYKVSEPGFGHSDYASGSSAPTLVFQPILAAMDGADIGASKSVTVSEDADCPSKRLSAPSAQRKKRKKVKKAKKNASRAGRRAGARRRLRHDSSSLVQKTGL